MKQKFWYLIAGVLISIIAGVLIYQKYVIKKVTYVQPIDPRMHIPGDKGISMPVYTTDGVLFKPKQHLTEIQNRMMSEMTKSFHAAFVYKIGSIYFVKSTSPQQFSSQQIASVLRQSNLVDFAEADESLQPSSKSTEQENQAPWYHQVISDVNSGNMTNGSNQVIIAICDTGVDPNHEDFKKQLQGSSNVNGSDPQNAFPVNTHGTLVAGVAASIAGGVTIYPIKVSDEKDGSTKISSLVSCIELARQRGARVVNLGYSARNSYAIAEMTKELNKVGGILVIPAGNQGGEPNRVVGDGVSILVGSVDRNFQPTKWSNHGAAIDIYAPGTEILSTSLNKTYSTVDGTSMSSAMVSATAALIFSIKSEFSATQVRHIILQSAKLINGLTVLNVEAALKLAKEVDPSRPEAQKAGVSKSTN